MSLQFVIDGYNIINHPQFIRRHKIHQLPQEFLPRFIRDQRLTGSPKNQVTIVFDGYPPAGGINEENEGINIIFSRKISADEKIKMLIEERADRKCMVIVSDDRELVLTSGSLGAKVMGVSEFFGATEKSRPRTGNGKIQETELNYSQQHKITEEFKKIWL